MSTVKPFIQLRTVDARDTHAELGLAGSLRGWLLEIVWSVSMKAWHGFTKHYFTAITIIAASLSFWLLGLALRQLPVGTAYAVWTGIGAVGAAVLGIAIFGESLSVARIGCIALIVCGILG